MFMYDAVVMRTLMWSTLVLFEAWICSRKHHRLGFAVVTIKAAVMGKLCFVGEA